MFRLVLFSLIYLAVFSACGIYSLSGASTGDAKSAEIPYFQNRASVVQPMLSRNLTEKLKDKIQSQTDLKLVNESGDTVFEGEITGYNVTPAAITGENVAAKNRLTITVKVRFTNNTNNQFDFDSSFSRYADFNATASLESVENDLIEDIADQLVEDIFNKAFVNW